MEEGHLTQEEIDTGVSDQNGSDEGFLGRVAKHPFVAGGAIAGSGYIIHTCGRHLHPIFTRCLRTAECVPSPSTRIRPIAPRFQLLVARCACAVARPGPGADRRDSQVGAHTGYESPRRGQPTAERVDG